MNIFKNLLVAFSILLSVANGSSQEYCMDSPTGFGRQATGGAGGKVVTVNTIATLKAALKDSEPAVIIVTKNITFGENQNISTTVKNKTLLGLKGVKLITTARTKNGGILGLSSNSDNIIIRNLIFEGPGSFDVDGRDLLTNTGCTNLWVDHCEFYDGVDGNFDNTKGADNITVSWCKFGYRIPVLIEGMTGDGSGDHRFSNLVGGSASDCPADGFYSITFQYCYWADSCAQRMPRARNTELHLLNCYYNTNTKNSLAIGLGAGVNGSACYVEGCDFGNVARVVNNTYDKVSGKEAAVQFVNCLQGGSNSGSVSRPDYSYSVLDVNRVESVVTSSCGAGATLDITLEGTFSSPCITGQDPLPLPENVSASATSGSITVTWNAVEGAEGYKIGLCYEEECAEYTVTDGSTAKTIDGLLEGITYRYQVKAFRGTEETEYTTPQTIVTKEPSATSSLPLNVEWNIYTSDNMLYVSGIETTELTLYTLSGSKALTFYRSYADISTLEKGMYILKIKTKDKQILTGKIILR